MMKPDAKKPCQTYMSYIHVLVEERKIKLQKLKSHDINHIGVPSKIVFFQKFWQKNIFFDTLRFLDTRSTKLSNKVTMALGFFF